MIFLRIYEDFMDLYNNICLGNEQIPDKEPYWNTWVLTCILSFEDDFEKFKFYTNKESWPYVQNNFAIWIWRNRPEIFEKWQTSFIAKTYE
jgi:hypothetical protein